MDFKRFLIAGFISATLSIGVATYAVAASPSELVGAAFSRICFDNLPDFFGSEKTLEDDGYFVTPWGEGEFEFSHASNGVWGALATGVENAACTVAHEGLSLEEAKQVGADLMTDWLGGKTPGVWEYDGVPSAWTMPFESRVLYLIYNEGGLSADIRNE